MKVFKKIIKNYNFFSKALHLRSLTTFWICLSLNKNSLTCRVSSRNFLVWEILGTLSIIVNSEIFRHIHVPFRHFQPYCGIFKTPCNSYIFRTLPYLESGIYKTQDIFGTLSRHILVYSERCVMLACWEPCHI